MTPAHMTAGHRDSSAIGAQVLVTPDASKPIVEATGDAPSDSSGEVTGCASASSVADAHNPFPAGTDSDAAVEEFATEHRPSRTVEICIAIVFAITAACLITAAILEVAP